MPQNSIQKELDKLNASTAEEIDALEVNLAQDGDDIRASDDGSGHLDDDLARDQIEGLTEVGPDLGDKGVDSVAPGRDDTSDRLRRNRPAGIADSEDTVEASLDEPRDEALTDRRVDRNTAA